MVKTLSQQNLLKDDFVKLDRVEESPLRYKVTFIQYFPFKKVLEWEFNNLYDALRKQSRVVQQWGRERYSFEVDSEYDEMVEEERHDHYKFIKEFAANKTVPTSSDESYMKRRLVAIMSGMNIEYKRRQTAAAVLGMKDALSSNDIDVNIFLYHNLPQFIPHIFYNEIFPLNKIATMLERDKYLNRPAQFRIFQLEDIRAGATKATPRKVPGKKVQGTKKK